MSSHHAPGRNFSWRDVGGLLAVVIALTVGLPHLVDAATRQATCSKADDGTTETIKCPSTRTTVSVPVPGPTVTVTVSPSSTAPSSSPPVVSSSPPVSSPSASPTPQPTSSGPVQPATNGRDITTANTGMAAWRDQSGQGCTDPTVYPARVNASDLGPDVTCAVFEQGILFDRDITVTAATFNAAIDTNGHTVNLNWVTIAPSTVEDICVHGDGVFNLYRSNVQGCSDAVRFDGDSIIESYLRTKAGSSSDHNDAVQAYQASSGGQILRSNIDARPVNGASYGISGGNGAIFLADGSKGTSEIRDNYLQGGGYTLRLNESQHYRVTGNVVVKGSYLYGPLDTTNSVPGAFLEWSGNTLSDGTVLAKP
jgi:hypothetical protein